MSLASRFPKYFVAMVLAALGLYLAGVSSVGLWDRDEPRYAQCTRQMLRSGDWVVPEYSTGHWRLEKPPLIYWLQLLPMKVFGEMSSAAVRLPSVLGMTGAAAILGLFARRFTGPRRALWSMAVFCTCGLAIAASKMCITDAVLLFFVITGQACLAFLYNADHRGIRAPAWAMPLFWISMGFAGLVKGPQAFGMHAMMLLILLLLDFERTRNWRTSFRWWKKLQPVIGIPLTAIVLAPWMILVHYRAPGFLYELFHKAAMHSTESMDGHGEPPGYHTILIFGTFFPWSLLLPTTITVAWLSRRLPHIRFAMAATAGPWLLMECVFTKLPFYVLPAFPGLAFLTADMLIRCSRRQFKDLVRPIFVWTVGIWAIVTLGLSAAPWASLMVAKPHELPLALMIAYSFFGVLYAGIVFLRFSQRRILLAARAMAVGMAYMILILFIGILPRLQFLRMSENIAYELGELHATGQDVPVAMIGYKEPSLAFYQGSGAVEEDDNYLELTPPAQWPRWIVIDQAVLNTVPANLRSLLKDRAEVDGVAYAAPKCKQTTAVIMEKILADP